MFKKNPGTLGSRLKEAREHRGYSQTALGELVGVDQRTISKIERGKTRQPRELNELAGALGVSAAWLQFGVEEIDELDEDALAMALASMHLSEEARRAMREYMEALIKKPAKD